MKKITRALISCTDKTGIAELVQFLSNRKIEILSTGGTADFLRKHGIPVVDVSDHTGSPEILDGRVKTLHPKIHGGILGLRDNKNHMQQMQENQIKPIDLVVVNLYEFEKTVADKNVTLAKAVENIDIGGPSMLRSAAKNFKHVAVVIDPSDYPEIMSQIEKTESLSEEFCFQLAIKVFQKTSEYDHAIYNYLHELAMPSNPDAKYFGDTLTLSLQKIGNLRYGENPHQKASWYRESDTLSGIVNVTQYQGKELSFNNILDMEAAVNCCREFKKPAVAIVKHLNPCGVATADKLVDAFIHARETDPVSSFGGIVALNKKVDKQVATILAETFFEVIIAPGYDEEVLAIFKGKKNLRVMKSDEFDKKPHGLDYRRISGGFLVQDIDNGDVDIYSSKVVTTRTPTEREWSDFEFAWKIVKHVKSNAIVFVKDGKTLGMGAGQMSRIDSVKIAIMKATENFENADILKGAVMASDAFFPFRDGIDHAAKFGIAAVIQPGGSVRDNEVIAACNEHGMAMTVTGMRHFKH